jgi:orotate phosphoribosyltransferase
VIAIGGAVRDAALALRAQHAGVVVAVRAIDRSGIPGGTLQDIDVRIRPVLTRDQFAA